MGMKKKRLVYVRKFATKFAAWLKSCKKVAAPVIEPEPTVEPEPVLWSAPDEPAEEKE
jgi:hypothetical protein